MTRDEFNAIEAYMLECMSDAAHDPEHIYRVLGRALELAKDFESVDYDLLITACLLHDIGRAEQFRDPSLSHAAVGAEKAAKWLAGRGYSDEFCERVRHCIRAHSFRTGGKTEVLEAQLLYDADKIEAAGMTAFVRTVAYNALMDEPTYTLDEKGRIDRREDAPESTVQEYHKKLRHVKEKFYTERAKEIASRYNDILDRAVESLIAESEEAREGLKFVNELLK